VHVLFNVFGVALWFSFINQLAEFVSWFSPAYPDLSGTERLAAEAPRQIANAHTVFNIANTVIFIGFAGQFARLVEWMIPDKPAEEVVIAKPKFLAEELLDTPTLALGRVRLEIGHMGDRIQAMMDAIMPAIISGNHASLRAVADIDDEVDILHGHIVTYLGKVSQKSLTESQTRELIGLMEAVNDLENIGDIIETDLVYLGNQRIDRGLTISPETRKLLRNLHGKVTSSTEMGTSAVADDDTEQADRVIALKEEINRITDWANRHEAERLVADEPNRLACYTVEVDIIEKLRRIYYFTKRMAKTVYADSPAAEAEDAVPLTEG
jgi:phosphate:Na+ symporter